MKKTVALIVACILALSAVLTVGAADGKVTYSGNAGQFIFEPGTDKSLTDLFPDFKGVMPGDSLTQKITVKNNANYNVKVNIYIRSLGAYEESNEFLSQLGLKVKKSAENEMAYMFDAKANETAQFTDWVYLGTLYSGGEVNLDVILEVPADLDNKFQNAEGYLEWEFLVEELPIGPDDPKPPQTGDRSNMALWGSIGGCSIVLLFILLFWRKKNKEDEE